MHEPARIGVERSHLLRRARRLGLLHEEPRHLLQLGVLGLAVIEAIDGQRAIAVELAAERGVDDVLERVEGFGSAAEQHFALVAGEIDAHAVGRIADRHVHRQPHRFERPLDEVLHSIMQFHHLRSFAASLLPPPAFFTRRSAGGRTTRWGAGPIMRLVMTCWPIAHRLLTVQ